MYRFTIPCIGVHDLEVAVFCAIDTTTSWKNATSTHRLGHVRNIRCRETGKYRGGSYVPRLQTNGQIKRRQCWPIDGGKAWSEILPRFDYEPQDYAAAQQWQNFSDII